MRRGLHSCAQRMEGISPRSSFLVEKGAKQKGALHCAAREGHDEIIKFLMTQEGFDLTSQDGAGTNPLHQAAKSGRYNTVELLLAHGVSPMVRSKEGQTPLGYAASGGHVRVAELLWGHQRQWGSDNSVLEFLKQGQLTAARVLLELPGFEQNMALHHAARWGHDSIVLLLLERGADKDATAEGNMAPLHYAAASGKCSTIALLHGFGADIESKSSRTPELDIDGTQFRRLHGPDWDPTVDDGNDWSPLHYAAAQTRIDTVSTLLKCGADVHALNNRRRTPLHLAASYYGRLTIRVLLDHGATIDAKDAYGETAAHTAARYGNNEGFSLLVKRGCDTTALDQRGRSLLHAAAANGRGDGLVDLLLRPHGPLHIDVQDNDGRTPLHVAAQHSSAFVVEALRNHGANIEAKDNHGRSPLIYAATGEQPDWSTLCSIAGYTSRVGINRG
jgi:ankyrin repeat protein